MITFYVDIDRIKRILILILTVIERSVCGVAIRALFVPSNDPTPTPRHAGHIILLTTATFWRNVSSRTMHYLRLAGVVG